VPDYDRYLARFYCPLAGGLRGGRTVEKTLAVAIEVPKQVSLQPVGQHAKQEMAGQVRGRTLPEGGLPTSPKVANVEITQARDFDIERHLIRHCRINRYARHAIKPCAG
jgi:hypothetical protein